MRDTCDRNGFVTSEGAKAINAALDDGDDETPEQKAAGQYWQSHYGPEHKALEAAHVEALAEDEARTSIAYWEKEAGNMDNARAMWRREAAAAETNTAHTLALMEDAAKDFILALQNIVREL